MSRWLKGRHCFNCGSSMVSLRFIQPHCFCCGSNSPFATTFEPTEPSNNRHLKSEGIENMYDFSESAELSIQADIVLGIARQISESSSAGMVVKAIIKRFSNEDLD